MGSRIASQVEQILWFQILGGRLAIFGWGSRFFTSMDNLSVMQVVDRFEHLLDGLGGILFRELALVTDAVEQFSPSC